MQNLTYNHQFKQPTSSCPLCSGQNLSVMLNRALYDRYLANINLYYTDGIDDFLHEEITPETCKFRQQMCDNHDEQLLKRQYAAHQFHGKIEMLSEYYKFHRDVPKIFQKSVFRILGKYFDRLRHHDYKKIKCVLKEEQGISLTTQKSEQSSFYSDEIKKSRYSTVLFDLDKNSQSESQILKNFCQNIDKAYENLKFKNDFKGQYYSGEKKFEQYLLNTKKTNQKTSKTQFSATNNQKVKNYNLLHKPFNYQLNSFTLKTDRLDSKKKNFKKKTPEILLQTNNTLKQTLKSLKKNKSTNYKSIQKTTANQTISREEKSKRMQKLQRTLEFQIQKNQNAIFKPFSTGLIGMKSNAMLKTLQQIYRPVTTHEKYHSDKSTKMSLQHNTHNLQKIYESKISGRKSSSNLKSKPASQHNSKEINSHLNSKDPINLIFNQNNNQTERHSLRLKQRSTTKCSSKKKLSRSKSVSKTTLNSHVKISEKALQTIDHSGNQKRNRSKSIKKNENLKQSHVDSCLKQKQNVLISANKNEKQLRDRQTSRKSLNSGVKEKSTSKKTLNSSKKSQKNGSKSNLTSARGVLNDNGKFQTIDPDANRNIDQYLEKKLTIVPQTKSLKAKFYN